MSSQQKIKNNHKKQQSQHNYIATDSSSNTNKNFNRKSLEAKRIYRHIRMYENELAVIKAELASEKQGLKDYIAGKEKFYQRHRSLAAKAENE